MKEETFVEICVESRQQKSNARWGCGMGKAVNLGGEVSGKLVGRKAEGAKVEG